VAYDRNGCVSLSPSSPFRFFFGGGGLCWPRILLLIRGARTTPKASPSAAPRARRARSARGKEHPKTVASGAIATGSATPARPRLAARAGEADPRRTRNGRWRSAPGAARCSAARLTIGSR
jgi:hypothetical protein